MNSKPHFVICMSNKGYAASLELRKFYEVIPDQTATDLNQIRVIDESGEDYLYPEACFIVIEPSFELEGSETFVTSPSFR